GHGHDGNSNDNSNDNGNENDSGHGGGHGHDGNSNDNSNDNGNENDSGGNDNSNSNDNGNGDDAATVTIRVQNDCGSAVSYVAVSLPDDTVPSSPSDGETVESPNGRFYLVESPTNNPFYSIKFEAQGEGIKDGEWDTFSYMLTEFDSSVPIQVQVKAGNHIETVTLNPWE
ncbi:MAG: hypothetical protein ACE5E7_17440, partial [Anaerolineae bacterium]